MITNNSSDIHPELSDPETIRNEFSGDVILPGHESYDRLSESFARKGNPSIILRPYNSEDIANAIKYALKNSLQISIRSGGHGLPGFATNEGGLVLDLSALNKIEIIDKSRNLVSIGAGALWGDVAKDLDKHHLVISSGDTKSVGVGGLTLGGGFGWLIRKVGLAIDNLVSAEIVTYDGKILITNTSEHPELFWAIKGGGGNFGVVTHFGFTAQSLHKVVSGSVQYGIENLQAILKSWRNYMRIADENLNTTIRIMPALFGNPPAIFILFCYAGKDGKEARNSIEPLLNFDTAVNKDIKEINYSDLLEEAMHLPPTIKIAVKSTFTENFSDEFIKAISKLDGPAIQIRSVNGKLNRIPPDSSAFPFRKSEVLISAGYFIPVTASQSEKSGIIKSWDNIKSYGSGVYVNFLSEEEDIKDIYPAATLLKLAEVKKKYDPQNIFRNNYNVIP